MTANAISECMFAQLTKKEIDCWYLVTSLTIDPLIRQSSRQMLLSTPLSVGSEGKELLVRFKDGSEFWLPLKDVKVSFPVQVAEYAVNARIHGKPAFAWWVPYVLKKRSQIIAKVKSKYWQRTHKYGFRIPKSIKEALKVDAENGITFWRWDGGSVQY
jgi:hypothetical protein